MIMGMSAVLLVLLSTSSLSLSLSWSWSLFLSLSFMIMILIMLTVLLVCLSTSSYVSSKTLPSFHQVTDGEGDPKKSFLDFYQNSIGENVTK